MRFLQGQHCLETRTVFAHPDVMEKESQVLISRWGEQRVVVKSLWEECSPFTLIIPSSMVAMGVAVLLIPSWLLGKIPLTIRLPCTLLATALIFCWLTAGGSTHMVAVPRCHIEVGNVEGGMMFLGDYRACAWRGPDLSSMHWILPLLSSLDPPLRVLPTPAKELA